MLETGLDQEITLACERHEDFEVCGQCTLILTMSNTQ